MRMLHTTSARDGDEQQQAAQQHAEQPAAARQLAVAFADEMRMEHDPERKDRASRSKTAAQLDAGNALAAVAGEGGVSKAAGGMSMQPHDTHTLPQHRESRAGKINTAPASYRAAMSGADAQQWQTAVEEHLQTHEQLGSFVEVIVPVQKKVLPSKWVYQLKTDAHGRVVRHKARYVVLGFLQRRGVDYNEVFSPTIRGDQIRLLVRHGAKQTGVRMRLHGRKVTVLGKGDVYSAYTTADMPEGEEVLFELPEGYRPKLVAPGGHKVVARSIKAQQGTKQAGRVWNRYQHKCLTEQGFVQCEAAPCIYMKELADGYLLAGILDDILFVNASDNKEAVQNAVKALSKYYEIKYSDTLEKFLGAEFEELDEGIYMHLNQYVTEMMSRFEIGEKTAPTPEASESDELSAADQALLLHADKKKYQEITGAVMFCMTTCRPDIAHAVNTLLRKMSAPRLCDLRTARRVLQYLNGTRRLGLLFKFETSAEHSGLLAYVDADWANDKVE